MPYTFNLKQLSQQCQAITTEVALVVMETYRGDHKISKKNDQSPLTCADTLANQLIINALQQLSPKLPIISEESQLASYELRRTYTSYWLIDPIDGTREFIKKNGQFTINIALIHQHTSILGVVCAPALNVTYFGWKNGGSFKRSHNKITSIHAHQLQQKNRARLNVIYSRVHTNKRMQHYLHNLKQHYQVHDIAMGSSLKICMVAEGKADLYPRLVATSQWDTAAAHCILEQAGGNLTQTNMMPLNYKSQPSLINPYFFAYGNNTVDWSQFLV